MASSVSAALIGSYPFFTEGEKGYKLRLNEIIGGNFAGKKLLNKPDKIYLENINLYKILCPELNRGSLRESFFVSQIKDLPQSYLALDDLEVGYGNKIPLWLFGFLY